MSVIGLGNRDEGTFMSLEDDLTSACSKSTGEPVKRLAIGRHAFCRPFGGMEGWLPSSECYCRGAPDNGRALMRFSTLGGRI